MSNESKTNEVKHEVVKYLCPVCGKGFEDIHSFSKHIEEHSKNEARRKLEEERKAKEECRKNDLENLAQLYAEKQLADKNLNKALDEYKKKYGNLVFPYNEMDIPFARLMMDWLRN